MNTAIQRKRIISLKMCIATIVVSAMVSAPAIAHQGATGVVKERMDMMGEISKAMKVIGEMVRGVTAFDASAAREAALEIKKHASMIPELFPAGTTEKPSEALSAIWENWEEFLELTNDMKVEADVLADTASNSSNPEEFEAAFGRIGRSCTSCHQKFRLKKH